MKKNFLKLIVLGLAIVFMGCNGDNKTESTDKTTDSTGNKMSSTDTSASKQSKDAVSVAPNLYKIAKDTMGIRVLQVDYKPGDSSQMHSHPDNVLYVVESSKSEFTMQDGSKQVRELKAGTTMILPGGVHSVKNIGTTPTNALLFEINRPNTAGPAEDPKLDPLKVAPNLYKLVKDTMNIRVLMADYKPGASSAMHYHPDNAIYVLGDSKAEFTMQDGSKQTREMKKGMIMIQPPGSHAVKNTGNSEIKVLIVEVNRPVK